MNKQTQRKRRHARIRTKIKGTASIPRLSVFRSNRYFYAQLIDDEKGRTIISSSGLSASGGKKGPLTEMAKKVGADLAKKAKTKKINKVVFDRNGFAYRGGVKALAESARGAGLQF